MKGVRDNGSASALRTNRSRRAQCDPLCFPLGRVQRTMMDRISLRVAFAIRLNHSRSEQPRMRARIADISKHSYMTKFNKGGFPG